MFPPLLESFGKISIGTSQDQSGQISEKVASKSSTDSCRPGWFMVVQFCDPAQLPRSLKCLIRAGLLHYAQLTPTTNTADNSERIMMMSRSAFVMTDFLPDFQPEKLCQHLLCANQNVYSGLASLDSESKFFNFTPKSEDQSICYFLR